jgi:hypothetical protein
MKDPRRQRRRRNTGKAEDISSGNLFCMRKKAAEERL